jgi:hypothetical protein
MRNKELELDRHLAKSPATPAGLWREGHKRLAFRLAAPYNSVSLLANDIYEAGVRRQLSAAWVPHRVLS